MATIGKLAVSLTARTRGFRTGMSRAGRQVAAFARKVGRVTARVAKYGAALTAVAAVAGAAFVRAHLKSVDALAKMSDQLGLSVDNLQALQLAGELAGVSQNTLTKAVQRFTVNVAEAAGGTGEAVDAFRKLQLDAAMLAGRGPMEGLKLVAERLKLVTNQTERVGIAYRLFGQRGLALINMLQDGSGALEAAEQDVKRLGLSLSRVDARMIEQANDSMTRFKRIIRGVGQQLAVQVAPFLTAFINRLIEGGDEGEVAGKRIATGMELVAKGVALGARMIQRMSVSWKIVEAATFEYIAGAVRGLVDFLALLGKSNTTLQTYAIVAGGVATAATIRMKNALDDLDNDTWANTILDGFKRIREEARRTAADVNKRQRLGGLGGLDPLGAGAGGAGSGAGRPGQFRQIVRSRFALTTPGASGGSKGPSTVANQLKMIEILNNMLRFAEQPNPVLIKWSP